MRIVWLAFATLFAALFVVSPALGLDVPKLAGRVNDYADMLPADAEARIARTLEAHEKATGQQFAVLTVKSLEGDDLKDFSIRTAEAWKLGRKKEDDGLLFLVVKDDRVMNLEVGNGLEGSITDALSARLIRGVAEPAFKAGNYEAGIQGVLNEIMRRENGSRAAPAPPPEPVRRRSGPSLWTLFVLLLFFGPFLLRFFGGGGGFGGGLGRRGRWYGGSIGGFGGGFGGGGFGRGGFGGGGFGGGGGFSGGGGSFSGGGASGRW